MADVGRSAAAAGRAHTVLALGRRTLASRLLFGQLEAERAGDWIGLGDAKLQLLPLTVRRSAVLADELLRLFVVAEIFVADRRDRHQAVAAEIDHRREEAERLDARDPAHQHLPALIGEES